MPFLLGYRILLRSCSCYVTVGHALTLNFGMTRSDNWRTVGGRARRALPIGCGANLHRKIFREVQDRVNHWGKPILAL